VRTFWSTYRTVKQRQLVNISNMPDQPRTVERSTEDNESSTHLKVRQRRVHRNTPVDEPVGTVDDTVVVETDEGLRNRLRERRVHRERDTVPVA
jgi:hypothetical protein